MSPKSVVNSLLEVIHEERPIAVVFMDAEARIWKYAPEDDLFHRNDSIFRDYFSDDPRFAYRSIDPSRAQSLASEGVGRVIDPARWAQVRERPSMPVATVMARVTSHQPEGGNSPPQTSAGVRTSIPARSIPRERSAEF